MTEKEHESEVESVHSNADRHDERTRRQVSAPQEGNRKKKPTGRCKATTIWKENRSQTTNRSKVAAAMDENDHTYSNAGCPAALHKHTPPPGLRQLESDYEQNSETSPPRKSVRRPSPTETALENHTEVSKPVPILSARGKPTSVHSQNSLTHEHGADSALHVHSASTLELTAQNTDTSTDCLTDSTMPTPIKRKPQSGHYHHHHAKSSQHACSECDDSDIAHIICVAPEALRAIGQNTQEFEFPAHNDYCAAGNSDYMTDSSAPAPISWKPRKMTQRCGKSYLMQTFSHRDARNTIGYAPSVGPHSAAEAGRCLNDISTFDVTTDNSACSHEELTST